MTPNPLYQALVERLEALLPPRVVSLLLREGLAAEGSDPEQIELSNVETILKGAVFRQLQTSRPADLARSQLNEVLEALVPVAASGPRGGGERGHGAGGTAVMPRVGPPQTGTEGEAPSRRAEVLTPALTQRLDELQRALRPLNLYFSWPEVQKLRAQLHLVEQEADRGEDPTSLIEETEQQLVLAHQKLEDQLVLQARELVDLEEALERVAPLGGSRIRRLESLVTTVRENQAQRMVAEAEVQRAQKLARDLRKLVESTVLDDGEAPPDLGRGDGRRRSPAEAQPVADPAEALLHVDFDEMEEGDFHVDPNQLSPEASQRLMALDVDGERQELEALSARHAELLRQAPELADEVAVIEASHRQGRPTGDALPVLAGALAEAETARREALRREFEALRAEVEGFPAEVDVTGLRRALSVALDVLNETLPPQEDILAIRELHAEAAERASAAAKTAALQASRHAEQRQQRRELIDRLESAWERATDVPRLGNARSTLRRALDALASAPVDAVDAQSMEAARDAEAAWERAVAEASDDRSERRRARARELASRLLQVPELPALRARAASLRDEALALQDQSELSDAHLRTMASMIDQFMADAKAAVATRLDQLAREAGEPVAPSLLKALQTAARILDEGALPDLAEVEAELASAKEERLSDLRQRYQRARQEARRLETADIGSSSLLGEAVDRARDALDGPQGEAMVAELERGLHDVEAQVAERLRGFEPRLEAALQTFKTVAKLNNDDVAAVRRVLNHLDSQRGSVERVSIGLQTRLFASLAEAEERLVGLSTAFEATRAIADQLVSSNQLDDLLSGLDALFGNDDDREA